MNFYVWILYNTLGTHKRCSTGDYYIVITVATPGIAATLRKCFHICALEVDAMPISSFGALFNLVMASLMILSFLLLLAFARL
jgi:hypothetical protein